MIEEKKSFNLSEPNAFMEVELRIISSIIFSQQTF
jgi:hypothetical protein